MGSSSHKWDEHKKIFELPPPSNVVPPTVSHSLNVSLAWPKMLKLSQHPQPGAGSWCQRCSKNWKGPKKTSVFWVDFSGVFFVENGYFN